MPNLTDINSYFKDRPNLMHPNLYGRFWRTNPFAYIPRKEFNLDLGRVPQVMTATHELPESYPFGLPKVTLSSGTGDPACDVEATVIKSGNKTRSYELEVAAFESEVICLTDLQFKFQAVQQVTNKEKGLSQYVNVFQSDWARVHNIGMHDKKLSTTGATSLSQKSDALYDFSTLTLPTFGLNWVHLDQVYDMLVRLGAGEYAIGNAGGQPVFNITFGAGYKRALFQDDADTRETINFLDPQQNFAARGISKSIRGFAPNVDEFPMRFAADGTTPIYPTINQNTSQGRESVPNPNYLTVENGGLAVYEVVTITCRDTYEIHPRPVGPNSFGREGFKAANYTGSINWINNPDMDKNPLGNKGYYRIDIQQAAKPNYPELGISILTLARD